MKGYLEVLEGGLLTTIQDIGRVGFRKYGIPGSGVMDTHAAKIVNWLVGNPKETPVIELTLQGGKFQFYSKAIIGISGARAEVQVNNISVSLNKSLSIDAGDILTIGRVEEGCRVYVGIRGDWELPKVMESYSTYVTAKFGGLEGRALKKGDRISWIDFDEKVEMKRVPQKLIPLYSSRQQIRIIPGPEWNWLNKGQQKEFLKIDFSISTQSNRMGIRLECSTQFQPQYSEISSSPVIPGIIQLPQGGSPIILMKDAQSIGGYPRIAKVADADLWRLGQVWSPVNITFHLISIKEAIKLGAFHKNILL